jgi:hypothetical protein
MRRERANGLRYIHRTRSFLVVSVVRPLWPLPFGIRHAPGWSDAGARAGVGYAYGCSRGPAACSRQCSVAGRVTRRSRRGRARRAGPVSVGAVGVGRSAVAVPAVSVVCGVSLACVCDPRRVALPIETLETGENVTKRPDSRRVSPERQHGVKNAHVARAPKAKRCEPNK